MILSVKREFWGYILDGSKTVEIRRGRRYRSVVPGTVLTINRRRYVAVDVQAYPSRRSMVLAFRDRWRDVAPWCRGWRSFRDAVYNFFSDGEMYAIEIAPEKTTRRRTF
ncbi:MAG TPA: ASCH domain-containing protein [Rhodothermales bacterium]|nr:ASCH domain-containing protein [Rhodothermales bacterium]